MISDLDETQRQGQYGEIINEKGQIQIIVEAPNGLINNAYRNEKDQINYSGSDSNQNRGVFFEQRLGKHMNNNQQFKTFVEHNQIMIQIGSSTINLLCVYRNLARNFCYNAS